MAKPVLKAFTDYPIDGYNGVHQVEVLAYDRDKYATVRIGSSVEDVKSGYLFRDPALTRHLSRVSLYRLPQEVGEPADSHEEVQRELKRLRRRRADYTLWVGDIAHQYKSLAEALGHMSRVPCTETTLLRRCRHFKCGFVSECLMEQGPEGFVTFTGTKGRHSSIKTRHFKKYFR